MIKNNKIQGLTVGELKLAIDGLSDDTEIFLENVEDKLYYSRGFESAILPCDESQFQCANFKVDGISACANCLYNRSYAAASCTVPVSTDKALYINVTI